MIRLLLRQLFFIITTFFGVTLITYYLHTLAPDDTTQINVISINKNEPTFTIAEEASTKSNHYHDYFQYLGKIFNGDLGISSSTRVPVTEEFIAHLPASIEIVLLASFLSLFLGLPLGVVSAINRRKATDIVINDIALVAYSMPIFWWGIILIMFFSLSMELTPVAGRLSFLFDIEPVTGFMLIDTLLSDEPYRYDAFRNALLHLTLPVLALATLPTAIITRITRQHMLETLSMDYILTAQSKGLSEFRIYWIHGLRNALLPITNVLGSQISVLMTGAMLTEYLFNWPGIGKWLLDALTKSDYESLQGGILITTTLVIFINAFIEMLQAWLNPRVRKTTRIYNG